MSYILAIYDKETDYANQLMDYLKRKQKNLSQIRVFTNENSLKEYLEHDRIDVLLLNESIPMENVSHENIKNICVLSEGNYIRENTGYPVIYKFQSAELVMQELFSYFPLKMSDNSPRGMDNPSMKIISIYSIARDTEKMIFALSLAKQYSKTGKTLYINLDVFQAFTEQDISRNENGLSEFIYYLKQNPSNLNEKIGNMIKKNTWFDYIQGVSFGPDLYELNTDDMLHWIEEIRAWSDYEFVIFNVGCFFEATLELFRSSSQLLYIQGNSPMEKVKYQNFHSQLLWTGYEDVIDKIEVIHLSKEEEESYEKITEKDLHSEVLDEFAYGYFQSKEMGEF